MFTARRIAFVLAVALVAYMVVVFARGLTLVGDGRPVFVLLGLAVLVLPVLGAWFLWAELRFGLAMQRLGREADVGADAGEAWAFARCKADVEAAPSDWKAWYRLAVAYGDAGDSRRGRAAMRQAIALRRIEGG